MQKIASNVRWLSDDRKEIYCIVGSTIPDNEYDSHKNIHIYDMNYIEIVIQREFKKIKNKYAREGI
jgi:hypothetical protein